PAFSFLAGDILHSARVWIRKSSEDISEAYELTGTDCVLDKAEYGEDAAAVTVNPVKHRIDDYADLGAKIEVGQATISSDAGQIGDTIVVRVDASLYCGTLTSGPGVAGSNFEYKVKWQDGASPAGEPSGDLIALYYNYVEDVSGGAGGVSSPRGYVLHVDQVVYCTSVYGVRSINSLDTLVGMFGNDALTNPTSNLACGAFLYGSANGWTNKFKICALDLRRVSNLSDATPAELMDLLVNWQTALYSAVDMHRDAYYLVPLTANETIHDACEVYVNVSSGITRQKEKRLYVSKQITGVADAVTDMDDQFGNGKWGESDYPVGTLYQDGYKDEAETLFFNVDADVEAAMATPISVNNERVTYIGCEYATIDDINIEGYYVAAIIAGWRASLPLGYDASGMKVPLISSIPSGLGYYSEDQLDALASSGWYMLKQDIAGGPVECYLQKTTAYESVEKGEESFIVALDYCMRDIRATLAPYIRGGLENRVSATNPDTPMTVRYLNKLNSAISLIRYKYVEKLEVFAAMEVVAVRLSEMKRTAAEVDVKFNHYYPVREITVTGYVE
ncbi:MAG: hypothetical protein PHX79_07595, partial [Sphaerochaetaceae bacterium]|nr:hypothetical protein [Sphaerochaetaceae bacterium]